MLVDICLTGVYFPGEFRNLPAVTGPGGLHYGLVQPLELFFLPLDFLFDGCYPFFDGFYDSVFFGAGRLASTPVPVWRPPGAARFEANLTACFEAALILLERRDGWGKPRFLRTCFFFRFVKATACIAPVEYVISPGRRSESGFADGARDKCSDGKALKPASAVYT